MLRIQIGYREWAMHISRQASLAIDFGCDWHLFNGSTTSWRVSWVESTGELYATDLNPTRNRFIRLGTYTEEGAKGRMRGWESGNMILESWFSRDAQDDINDLFGK